MNELDIVISFDDTGSMSSVRKLVRNNINKLTTAIKTHVPSARIGIVVHNDYCDRDTIQYLDLTDDIAAVKKFVDKDTSCGGGDSPECYELAINYFHSKFSWKAPKKICILIGDEVPHQKGYTSHGPGPLNKCIHSWKEELKECSSQNIQVYAIQALNNRHANSFYESVASLTGGIKLELMQFQHIESYILGIFHKENDTLAQFEDSQAEFKTNFSLKGMFDKLFNRVPTAVIAADKELMWKFQVMNVPSDVSIKHFVEANGIRYKAGKGYYQLTKPETIQDYKEILMVKRDTDEVIMDTDTCREMLGHPQPTSKFGPRNSPLSREYDIYVQSTSYNRKLINGTKFLYELDYK